MGENDFTKGQDQNLEKKKSHQAGKWDKLTM